MGFLRPRLSFLHLNAWKNQNQNSLRYNTAQQGSVVPMVIGTIRQQTNVIDIGGYKGPKTSGKGVGQLPLGGTANANTVGGKGFGGGAKGSKKSGSKNYSADVVFAFCEGGASVSIKQVWASASVADFSSLPLNLYSGANGQPSDPVFVGLGHDIGYSGTLVTTATPLDLGPSPALPNLGGEIVGFLAGTGGSSFPDDANPGDAATFILTDPQRGAGFPLANLDDLFAGSGVSYGDYCQAAGMLISITLDGQQTAAQWIDGLAKLTNTAVVWSGELLKFVPFGDVALSANGAAWTPNLIPAYALTDDHFLPWNEHQDGHGPDIGQEDPILVTRSNASRAHNWVTIEYTDRVNAYTATTLPVYDQGAIDLYGRRGGDSISGKPFCAKTSAQVAAQIHLQRLQYIRNNYKFKLGWQFDLLEPMDIVTLTGRAGDLYLDELPVRILSLDEDKDGAFTVEAEEIGVGDSATPPPGVPCVSPTLDGRTATSAQNVTTLNTVLTTSSTNGVIFTAVVVASLPGFGLNNDLSVFDVTGGGLAWERRSSHKITGAACAAPLCPSWVLDLEVWWAPSATPLSGTTITTTINGVSPAVAAVSFGMAGTTNYLNPFDGSIVTDSYSSATPVPTALTVSGLSTLNACDTILAFVADFNYWTSIGAINAGPSAQPAVDYLVVDRAYASTPDSFPSLAVHILPVSTVQSPIKPVALQNFAPYGWISIVDAIKAP